MEKAKGKSILNRIAIAPIKVYREENDVPQKQNVADENAEVKRFEDSVFIALTQLEKLQEQAKENAGSDEAEIFEAHQMMLQDEGFQDSIKEEIRSAKVCAQYACYTAGETYAGMFEAMEDAYMRARAADVRDIVKRLIRVLTGGVEETFSLTKSVILFAEDLSPSQTVSLDKKLLKGIVTRKGSVNSHTAILARSMGIPALVTCNFSNTFDDDKMVILDGERGEVILSPDEDTLREYEEKLSSQEKEDVRRQTFIDRKTITKDGKEVLLCANIASDNDVEDAIKNGAEGIGLFRSEFLYLGRENAPSEEEQFESYKKVCDRMQGKPVIVRTLDIGADKKCPYLGLQKEENPALGMRAIRICLNNHELFKVQLRALLRAAVCGNLQVMYPMITSVWEVEEIFQVVSEAEEELKREGIAYAIPKQGIMIETPAAVMMSEELASKVDFFSIGTNDLTQYTLALDRVGEDLDRFYDPHHPAVIRLIQKTIENAHKAGIPVGICGELGSDESIVPKLIQMGIDELSMSPAKILPLRERILLQE